MSGAAAASNAIAEAAQALYARLKHAADVYARAYHDMRASHDLDTRLFHAIQALIAIEDLGSEADNFALVMRTKIGETMAENGTPPIRTQHHTAYVSTKPARAHVVDPDEIPTELLIHPPPRPDLQRIRELLKSGRSVPGAALVGNGEPVLNIRPNKREAA